ncbi:MAG: hypothetical protein CVU39_20130 [Chloroflexi bacterium HGW-Chloroflexi-10]|jgi:DegV family protein with EDD domain|nr:MAG: hypothetical protein CVU39_20130 [Chloroflexi bacterium HGW-Chloroflexi-10]
MHIVTDSGMDLSAQQKQGLEIHQVPLKLTLDGKTYRSGVDIQPEEFYELLKTTDDMPVTSLPSPGEFAELYQRLAKTGEIFSIHISSGLSNTMDSARAAAQMVPDAVIHFFDTLTLSGAQGWQVEAAARAFAAGWSLDKVTELVEKVRQVTETIYTLPDLKYLIHGGRISHLKGMLASLLHLKPLIGVSKTDGKYTERGKTPTFKRALEAIAATVAREIPEGSSLRVQIAHTANPEGADILRGAMDKRFDCHWLPYSTVAPALGAHTGLGLVGLIYAPLNLFPEIPGS